jgi:multimeric flavodoxin WrbA
MRAFAVNGSARRDGNTAILIRHVLRELEKEGIETDMVQLGGETIRGCTACMKCWENKNGHCAVEGDIANELIAKMAEADAVILGSPTYFTDVTAEMKALIDRAGYVAGANGGLLTRKVGAAVIAVRRAGSIHAFDTINHFFAINQMIVPGSIYWNVGIGRNKGEVESDEEGIRTMQVLGGNIAWLLRKIHG